MTGRQQEETKRIALIVEDQTETRAWLAAIVRESFAGITVLEAVDLASARNCLQARRDTDDGLVFDLALIDLGLPDGSGVDLIRELNEHFPGVAPIVTTIYDDDTHLFEAIAAGAKGYLLKDQDTATLAHFLRRMDLGEPPLSPSIARRMLEHFRAHPPASSAHAGEATQEVLLTPREVEVLRLIGRGLRVGEAARILSLSEHTVADYVKSIYVKLNISSRAEAGLEAARRGLA